MSPNEVIWTEQILLPHIGSLGTGIRINIPQRLPQQIFQLSPTMTSFEELGT